jgi:hypothetical protein
MKKFPAEDHHSLLHVPLIVAGMHAGIIDAASEDVLHVALHNVVLYAQHVTKAGACCALCSVLCYAH